MNLKNNYKNNYYYNSDKNITPLSVANMLHTVWVPKEIVNTKKYIKFKLCSAHDEK